MKNQDKRGRKVAPQGEAKSEKFIRIVNPRTVKAVATLRQIAKAVSSKAYDVDDNQVILIMDGLHQEVNLIKTAFDSRTKTTKKEEIKGLL